MTGRAGEDGVSPEKKPISVVGDDARHFVKHTIPVDVRSFIRRCLCNASKDIPVFDTHKVNATDNINNIPKVSVTDDIINVPNCSVISNASPITDNSNKGMANTVVQSKNATENTQIPSTSDSIKPKRSSIKRSKRSITQTQDTGGFKLPRNAARASKLIKNNIEISTSNKFEKLDDEINAENVIETDVEILEVTPPKIQPIMAKPDIKYSELLKKMKGKVYGEFLKIFPSQ
ncbi:hypothetical protein X975_16345, partial [Stegodyphus mimosarum]